MVQLDVVGGGREEVVTLTRDKTALKSPARSAIVGIAAKPSP
jgi:hypothetical protein